MASAVAFLMRKRYETIRDGQLERERKRKEKPVRIPPPPESTEDTAVWFWKLRNVPVTVMLDKELKEVWCNGETLETQKVFPQGTGEQTGLSFTIKVPNIEHRASIDSDQASQATHSRSTPPAAAAPPPADHVQMQQTDEYISCDTPPNNDDTTLGLLSQSDTPQEALVFEPIDDTTLSTQNASTCDKQCSIDEDCLPPNPDPEDNIAMDTDADAADIDQSETADHFDQSETADNDQSENEESQSHCHDNNTSSRRRYSSHDQRKSNPHIGRLRNDNENSNSSVDSMYYDASDDPSFVDAGLETGFSYLVANSTDKPTTKSSADLTTTTGENSTTTCAAENSTTTTGALFEHFVSDEFTRAELSTIDRLLTEASTQNFTREENSTTNDAKQQMEISSSEDSGFEMAEEQPRFFFHDARIRCFMFGEHRVFELYVDGSMIQEHTKQIISDADTKNDVSKKKD